MDERQHLEKMIANIAPAVITQYSQPARGSLTPAEIARISTSIALAIRSEVDSLVGRRKDAKASCTGQRNRSS